MADAESDELDVRNILSLKPCHDQSPTVVIPSFIKQRILKRASVTNTRLTVTDFSDVRNWKVPIQTLLWYSLDMSHIET